MNKSYAENISIEGRLIGVGHPTYFVADIAANHDSSLSRAKELIHMAAEAGADAAKFQHFDAATIVSDKGFKALGNQASHQANWKKSVYEVYEDASLKLNWSEQLKNECEKAGITFFTSPYSLEIVDQIDQYVEAYKIGSGDITWLDIVTHIAKKNKPYIIATGASSLEDVQRTVEQATKINKEIILLQCNTNYTASLENFKYIQLNVLGAYQKLFPGMILGLSDHTPGHATVLGAVALGGRVIEKHFTDDISREGPDHAFSMDPTTWRDMVNRTRELEAALGDTNKKVEYNERETVVLQRRCLRASKDLARGAVISTEDVDVLRPAPLGSIPPYQLNTILGKQLVHDKEAGDMLSFEDFNLS